jgi:hypothetical protein
MNLFKKLFGAPPPLNHTSQVFVKWHENAKKYGPYELGELQAKPWSNLPKIAKLSGDKRWRSYNDVLSLLNSVQPSELQRKNLEKLKITEPAQSFAHAQKLFEEEKREKKASADKLPATKDMLKKLQENEIKHGEGIPRGEAKALLEQKEKKERKDELLSLLKERGIELTSKTSLNVLEELEHAHPPSDQSLAELKSDCRKLDSWKIKYNLPKIYTQDSVDDFIHLYDEAIIEAEGAVDELKEGFIKMDNADYAVEGIAEGTDFTDFMADLAKRVIKENWDSGKNLKSMIKKHFPESTFEKID